METLDLCRRFFEAHGYPLLRREFAGILDSVAAARVGGGSDVLGADDEYSRGPEWGPTFQIFLPDDIYELSGSAIRDTMNRCLPKEFEGYPTASGGGPGIDVFAIHGFLRERLGLSRFPEQPVEWLRVPEAAIRGFIAGQVFYDPEGELTQTRSKYAAYYPADVWKLTIARTAYACWFYGEYNYPTRISRRNDRVTGLIARGMFAESAMRLVFLLNRRYAPYWKWLHWEFVRLPTIAAQIDPLLGRLTTSQDMDEQADAIVEVCRILRWSIRKEGLVPSDSPLDYLGAFDIMRTLEDIELARQPVRTF